MQSGTRGVRGRGASGRHPVRRTRRGGAGGTWRRTCEAGPLVFWYRQSLWSRVNTSAPGHFGTDRSKGPPPRPPPAVAPSIALSSAVGGTRVASASTTGSAGWLSASTAARAAAAVVAREDAKECHRLQAPHVLQCEQGLRRVRRCTRRGGRWQDHRRAAAKEPFEVRRCSRRREARGARRRARTPATARVRRGTARPRRRSAPPSATPRHGARRTPGDRWCAT